MKTHKTKASFGNLLFVMTVLFFISCNEASTEPIAAEREIMDLNNLSIGQEFSFVYLKGFDYRGEDDDFQYTGDTLVLKVLAIENNRLLISERLTDQSTAMTSDDPSDNVWGLSSQDSYIESYWIIRNDSLIIDGSSNLLFTTSLPIDQNLPLRNFTEKEVDITGWKTSHPYTSDKVELFTVDYNLFNQIYDSLNILINNQAMKWDGPGLTIVYSLNHGIVKSSIVEFWSEEGVGWDRL